MASFERHMVKGEAAKFYLTSNTLPSSYQKKKNQTNKQTINKIKKKNPTHPPKNNTTYLFFKYKQKAPATPNPTDILA